MKDDFDWYQKWCNGMKKVIEYEKRPVFVEGGVWCCPEDEEEIKNHLEFHEKIQDRLNDRPRKNENH